MSIPWKCIGDAILKYLGPLLLEKLGRLGKESEEEKKP